MSALIRADAIRLPLADESVDLVITSPPYFALRSYQDDGTHYDGQIGSEPTPAEFLAALWRVTDECWRVLKPTGSLWVNLGDKYDSGTTATRINPGTVKDGTGQGWNQKTPRYAGGNPKSLMGLPWRYALGLICPDEYRPGGGPQWVLRAEVIWSKSNGLPESVTDRVRRSHEQWFHLTKAGRYFAAVDEVREPHTGTTSPQAPRAMESGKGVTHRVGGTDGSMLNPLGKLPGSVWTIPSEPLVVPDHLGVDHFAAFPQEWPRRIILGWSPSGICVKCGEGRRPVVERTRTALGDHTHGDTQTASTITGGPFSNRGTTEATITGYACACDVPLAPTRPAVVLDPFGGTGTVPMVARALGRFGVGVDLSRDYLRLARWRITRSGHGTKSLARTNRERQGKLL